MSPSPDDISKAMLRNEARARMLCASRADDLVSAGNEGIALAVSRFDESRDLKFSTYVEYYINKAHVSALKGLAPVHIPFNAHVKVESCELSDLIREEEDAFAAQDRTEAVNASIARLPSKLAKIVRLYFFAGLTMKEISKRKRCSVARVQQLLQEAVDAMRATLLKELY